MKDSKARWKLYQWSLPEGDARHVHDSVSSVCMSAGCGRHFGLLGECNELCSDQANARPQASLWGLRRIVLRVSCSCWFRRAWLTSVHMPCTSSDSRCDTVSCAERSWLKPPLSASSTAAETPPTRRQDAALWRTAPLHRDLEDQVSATERHGAHRGVRLDPDRGASVGLAADVRV